MKQDYQKSNTALFFGAISKDTKGQAIKEFLENDQLLYKFDEHEDNYTGQCAIIIVNGERTPLSNWGVNESIRTELFNQNKNMLEPYKFLYLEGFFISSNYEIVKELMEYASGNDKPFAYNLWGEFWINTYRDKVDEIIPYCDYVFGNLIEFQTLTDNKYTEAEDVVKAVACSTKHNTDRNRIVLISMDKHGAILDNYSFKDDTHEIVTVPSQILEDSQVVDTCCAGDTFVGGFLAGHLNGKDFKESIELGHKMASIVIQRIGWYFELK